jgi:hypothetical protein
MPEFLPKCPTCSTQLQAGDLLCVCGRSLVEEDPNEPSKAQLDRIKILNISSQLSRLRLAFEGKSVMLHVLTGRELALDGNSLFLVGFV